MDFTTLARVKEALGITGASSDAVLSQIITSVSNEMERLMDRHAQSSARTEIYQMRATKRLVLLRGYPVNTAATFTVKVSTTADFSSATALTANEEYVLDPVKGEIRFLINYDPIRDPDSGRPIAPIYVEVSYTGGMATDYNNLLALYPELAQAADMQAVHTFKRRATPGQTATDMGESSAEYVGELALIAITREAARRFRRMVWGG